MSDDIPDDRIAIVGMAGRFPGAPDVRTFWRNLLAGKESVRFFSDDELEDAFDAETRRAPNFVKARPILDDIDQFDAEFFRMQPREAALTDPQQRIFLECAWEALEDAGYDPQLYPGVIGIFAGASMNTYFLHNVCHGRPDLASFASDFQVGSYERLLGANRDFLATRTSYKLDLRGPSATVQTACSTSLVAVVQACQTLLLHGADMMLAGGVSITVPQRRGYLHQEGGMVAADGRCRPFDAAATGTVFGDGAGIVVLKRLADAVADGDHVYATILGCGLSNDGAGKVGFTAPSVGGQVAAISQALAQSGVSPRTIGYVECHGTATPLGDPIEVTALSEAFRRETEDVGFCAIGSVKGNVGHLEAAAGVTGLIKTALMLQHRTVVPTLHYRTPNPHIDWAGSPFTVASELLAWPAGEHPRRAGVSSLGVGGTNAHVVLEELPARLPLAAAGPSLLVLSARSGTALSAMRRRLADHLSDGAEALSLADVEFTCQVGRRHFTHRCAVVAYDIASAAERLRAGDSAAGVAGAASPPLVFLFPGQGSQYPGMATALYQGGGVFRETLDQCAAVLRPLGVDLLGALHGGNGLDDAKRLAATAIAQPAIFSVSYALAALWRSYGLEPSSLLGHSLGEFVAACLAGVFSLEEALGFVAARGKLMGELPPGAMVAVGLPEAEIETLLGDGAELAAVNGPSSCVLGVPLDALTPLCSKLDAAGVRWRRLQTSHAFHTSCVEPVLRPLLAEAKRLTLQAPAIPFVSTVTGEWIRPEEALSPNYWAEHARKPVRFGPAVSTMLAATERPMLLEVGPGSILTSLALQAGRSRFAGVAASLPGGAEPIEDADAILTTLGRLWVGGVSPDWHAVSGGRGRRVALPTYPFERRRHWIDAPAAEPDATLQPAPHTIEAHMTPSVAAQAEASNGAVGSAVRNGIIALAEDLSGDSIAGLGEAATFLEMGFDSLLLSRLAQQVQQRFKVVVTFRKLMGELSTIPALESFILASRPELAAPPPAAPPLPSPAAAPAVMAAAAPPVATDTTGVAALMQAQITAMTELVRQQLDTLQRMGGVAPQTAPASAVRAAPAPTVKTAPAVVPAAASSERPARFQSYAMGSRRDAQLSALQRRHVDALVARLTAKTAGSKQRTQTARSVLADPRAVAGFRGEWKELVYPIVCARAEGARLWDVDGNEYIDLVNGYGPTAFGHSPDFVVDALRAQIDKGFAIGPQAEQAGEVAALFCEMTGNERMTFCNTGSEAVMAAFRLARNMTGRSRVVMFGGAYHGQFDEVLVKNARRADGSTRSVPIAGGIPASAVENIVVLDYGTPDSLEWIRNNAGDLAAVIVEPVQSRHPSLQPFEFLRDLRVLTEAEGIAFIMDEIVTGFRVHPGGMQTLAGIRADLATYGKVVGGGLPIGILAGKAKFMDGLDGGAWQYGDDSVPEVGVTFFAGTFVRHPLAVAAAKAVLTYLRDQEPAIRAGVEARAGRLAEGFNALFARHGLKARAEHFSSLLYFSFYDDDPMLGLLPYHLRDRGVHVQDGFPIFVSTAHTDADVDHVLSAYDDALAQMARDGAIVSAAVPTVLTPTESQMEIWLSAQMGEDASAAFNESVTLRLRGPLDHGALTETLSKLLARHDGLRLRFAPTGESMMVAAPEKLRLETIDATGSAEPEALLRAYVAEDAQTPFDLVEGLPVRVRLFALAPDDHALVLTAHHIVCDGWSINVLVQELAVLYAEARAGTTAALDPLMPFSEYAALETVAGQERQAALQYWTAQLADLPAPVDLPTSRPRKTLRSHSGATATRRIGPALHRALKEASARQGCTLFVSLLGAFEILMGRLADTDAVVIGVPTAGQSKFEGKSLVGHCVNFLPVRARWDATTTIADHCRAVMKSVLDANEYGDCTLGSIVRALDPVRTPNRLPLTELQFNLEHLADELDAGDLRVTVSSNPKARVTFDLFCNVTESSAGLQIDCDYNTDLFDREIVEHWLECYEALLGVFASDAEAKVTRAPMLSAASAERILRHWNDTAAAHPAPGTTLAAIVDRAAAAPDAVAVIAGDARLSYRALLARAAGLAERLRAVPGSATVPVAVAVERTDGLVVALLAAWMAGRAYLPLDPSHPPARLRRILADAKADTVIVDDATTAAMRELGIQMVAVTGPPGDIAGRWSTLDPASTAYVIYTSGSTGEPKGVAISHASLFNLLTSVGRDPGVAVGEALFAVTTVAFDIAALELFAPLVAGGAVVIGSPKQSASGAELLRQLEASGAAMVQATPSLWTILLEAGFRSWPGLKMLCGGEPLARELADQLLAGGGRLWNMYGPTETTIWSALHEVERDGAPITVGYPVANTQLHVVDAAGQLVPFGVTGELLIGGDGVALGYVGRDDLTAERFVRDPFGLSSRLYRTGDSARRLPSGAVQVLGRTDLQVKLRGFRIELGEIEAVIARQSGVAACAVALREAAAGTGVLTAYLVGKPTGLASNEVLRQEIGRELPEYMMPSAWVRLERLPLSANGKLDRALLPAPELAEADAEPHAAPETALEETLSTVWAEVLQLDRVSRNADLFSLGADSIHMFQIAARSNRLGVGLRVRQLLEGRTVAGVAAAIERERSAQTPAGAGARPSLVEWAARRAGRTGSA